MLRQENCCNFEASLGYIAVTTRPALVTLQDCFKNKTKKKKKLKGLNLVVHICNSNTWKAEAGRSRVQDHPVLK